MSRYTNEAANPFLVENNEEGRAFIKMMRKSLANGHSIRVRYRGPRVNSHHTRAADATHMAVYIYHTLPRENREELVYREDRELLSHNTILFQRKEMRRLREDNRFIHDYMKRLQNDIDQLTNKKLIRR